MRKNTKFLQWLDELNEISRISYAQYDQNMRNLIFNIISKRGITSLIDPTKNALKSVVRPGSKFLEGLMQSEVRQTFLDATKEELSHYVLRRPYSQEYQEILKKTDEFVEYARNRSYWGFLKW